MEWAILRHVFVAVQIYKYEVSYTIVPVVPESDAEAGVAVASLNLDPVDISNVPPEDTVNVAPLDTPNAPATVAVAP